MSSCLSLRFFVNTACLAPGGHRSTEGLAYNMPPPLPSQEQQGWRPVENREQEEWNKLHELQAQYPNLMKQVRYRVSLDVARNTLTVSTLVQRQERQQVRPS